MALTRAFLKSMTLTDEQVSAIIEEHSATVTGLKGEITKYKEDAEKVPDLQKKLEDYEKDDWKGKYEKEHADFEGYKTEQDKKASYNAKEAAYKKMLEDSGVSSKVINLALKASKETIDNLKIGADGKFENATEVEKGIKEAYADYITTETTHGANVSNPPGGEPGKMTKKEIMEIKDAGERQKAIAENHELFGF
nr:MAG TPA: minor structural protein [Caudoviricetes sp.]